MKKHKSLDNYLSQQNEIYFRYIALLENNKALQNKNRECN